MNKLLNCLAQILVFILLAVAGDALSHTLPIAVPGGIIGMGLLFILLKTNIIPVRIVEQGANLLIANLLLFFVPSAVGIIQYQSLFAADGIKLTIVIVLSTITVMIGTGTAVSVLEKVKVKR